VAIGLLTSSLTDNQVISFISAMFACFFVYFGFDAIGGLEIFKPIDSIIYQLGINLHFASMSRGVIDSRDLIYFLSLIFLILYITRFSLLRR
jgi:ABC-2 type transport system permease protein